MEVASEVTWTGIANTLGPQAIWRWGCSQQPSCQRRPTALLAGPSTRLRLPPSGRGHTCLGLAGPEWGAHPNLGRAEPHMPPTRGCPGERGRRLAVSLSWCWGSQHPRGGPRPEIWCRLVSIMSSALDFKPVTGSLGLYFSHLYIKQFSASLILWRDPNQNNKIPFVTCLTGKS